LAIVKGKDHWDNASSYREFQKVRLLGPGFKQEIALVKVVPRRFTGTFF
jgi:hypothetical protein